jgi:hypothetical protein
MTNDEKQLLQIRAIFPGIEILSDEEGDFFWVWRDKDSRQEGHYFASPVAALAHFTQYLQGLYDQSNSSSKTTVYPDAF